MRAKDGRTVTETARRAQIITAAVETIAELGYTKASFTRIAERAGLSSTGLISYHFAGKDELVEQVVHEIFSNIGTFMGERLDGHATARAALRAYIEATVEFAATRSEQMRALVSILMGGGLGYGPADERKALEPLESILRWGQSSGEFRAFDVGVAAMSIKRATDGPLLQLGDDVELDATAYADELVSLFDAAIRAER